MVLEDEPNVYETPDSPENAYIDHVPPPEYQSEYISNESVNPNTARSNFNLSQADTSYADFRTSKNPGLQISARPETRDERLARIQREIAEMAADNLDPKYDLLLSQLKCPSDGASLSGTTDQTTKVASQISLESIERLSMLESRISDVEARINVGTATGLAAQVELLRLKIDVVTQSNISQDLTQRLVLLNQESAALLETPILTRINNLYEIAAATSTHLESIPMVLTRLRSLRSIHENAAESQKRLGIIRDDLSRRDSEIKQWQHSLRRLEEQMMAATTTVEDNTEKLRSIIQPLM